MDKRDDTFIYTIGVPSILVTKEVKDFERTCADMINLYAKKNHD